MAKLDPFLVLVILYGVFMVEGMIDPKLLLPFHGDTQVNYTINAEEGCYSWKSIAEDVATIHPVESTYDNVNMCSRSAMVVVRSTKPSKRMTLIIATNVKTGMVLQCDVIIDKIHAIDIVSRTKELYLEDPPEKLKIRALDQEGNTFSSTAGMVFEWTLSQVEGSFTADDKSNKQPHHHSVPAQNILLIQRFIDTKYISEEYVHDLEKKGKMSDSTLISGIQTGTAVVVADLISTIECHRTVPPSSVQFVVRDKVMLVPSHDIYLLRHSYIRYKVERWRQGKSTEIIMPSSQYFLQVRDVNSDSGAPVISLEQSTSVVTGLNDGMSQIFLIDQHLKHYNNLVMEQAKSDIYVAEAAYLKFEIEPYNKWILQVDCLYIIHVHIYSEDNKRIWPSDNIRLNSSLNVSFLEILDSVKNGTWYHVRTLKVGDCDISSLLKGVVKVGATVVQAGMFGQEIENIHLFDRPIAVDQTLQIFNKIRVVPSLILFPWQPEPAIYKYRYRASGGSGNFTWSVNETESSNISFIGLFSIRSGSEEGHRPRRVTIKALDIKNEYHYGEAAALLAPPAKLQFALSTLEAEVGGHLNLYIGMYAKIGDEHIPFTDCSKTKHLHWVIQDESIFEFSEEEEEIPEQMTDPVPTSPSCVMRQVRVLKEGHTTVMVTYSHEYFNFTLQTSTIIASFNPLVVLDPSQIAIVSLDSTKELSYQGGPNPWPLLPSGYEKLIGSDDENVRVTQKVSAKGHLFVAHCLRLGAAHLTLTVQNRPCSTNPFPVKTQVSVQVSCAVPSSLKLTTQYLPSECPLFLTQTAHTIIGLAGDTLQITLTAYDDLGNQFDNFTSLLSRWKIAVDSFPPSLAEDRFTLDSNKQRKHFFIQDLSVPLHLGNVKLEVTIDSYKDSTDREVCSPHHCRIEPTAQASMVLVVVGPVTISPYDIVMFNRPNHTESVEIHGGSGYFRSEIGPESSSGRVVNMTERERAVDLRPVMHGHAYLKVVDLCIPKATSVQGSISHAEITVSDVSSLHLSVNHLIEIDTFVEAKVRLFDMKELSMPNKFDLDIEMATDPLDVVSIGEIEKERDGLSFRSRVTGLSVGVVNVRASTLSRDGKLITSNVVKITVFPLLKLLPPIITVIQASEFHLYVEGGPPDDVQLQFDSADNNIASVSSNGVMTAHNNGNTSITVSALTKDGQVFHGQSPSLVYVVQLTGVWIHIPTNRFNTESIVPVHVYGSAGQGYNAVSLDSDAAGLVFAWKVNNHAVLSIESVHVRSKIEIPDTLKFTMHIKGLSPGQSTVSLMVSATKTNLHQLTEPILEADIQVTVFDPLIVLNPLNKAWATTNSMLITPETTYNVVSNRDTIAAKMGLISLCKSCGVNITIDNSNSKCISVNGDHKTVTSGKNPCEATILVSSYEQFGAVQTLAVHIKVKPISYVMALIENKFYTKDSEEPLVGFPLGSRITVSIQQFDNFGSRFDTSDPDPDFFSNRNDLLEITPNLRSNLLNITASSTGVTIFKVWNNRDVSYFFPLNVISVINPAEKKVTVTVGVKKCFTSRLVDSEGKAGIWQISKHKSFQLDSDTGAVVPLAKAVGELEYSIQNVQSKIILSSEVFWIKFDNTKLPGFITNARSQYLLPIEIGDRKHDHCDGLETEMTEIAQSTFECTIFLVYADDYPIIYETKLTYVSASNTYACVLDLVDLGEENEIILSTSKLRFTISLGVSSEFADRGISLQSPVTVKFVPAFKLMNSSSIILVSDEESLLCISATMEVHQSIQLTTTHPRYITFRSPEDFEDDVVCHNVVYVSDVQNQSPEDKYEIKLYSSLTHQEEIVEVYGKDVQRPQLYTKQIQPACVDQQSPTSSWIADQYSFTYLSFLITVLVIILSTFIIMLSCGFFTWAFSPMNQQTQQTQQSSSPQNDSVVRRSPGIIPYSPSNSYMIRRASPRGSPSSQSDSPSPGRLRLWSTYYEPQSGGT